MLAASQVRRRHRIMVIRAIRRVLAPVPASGVMPNGPEEGAPDRQLDRDDG
jgi:hypothetical protein